MTKVPENPRIFHITHVVNLAGIVKEGGIWCDVQRIARKLGCSNIGHLHIKQRRLSCDVRTRADGKLGEYVPFNFCPRSVMLYAVSRGHQDYDGGQENIIHLVSDVSTAASLGRAWAFTDRHAELGHALHFDDVAQLGEVDWNTMPRKYWTEVSEERQAEFLVREFFPWSAVISVAVMTKAVMDLVDDTIADSPHKPTVTIQPAWYY